VVDRKAREVAREKAILAMEKKNHRFLRKRTLLPNAGSSVTDLRTSVCRI
jgi:hypothetical protein